MDNEKLEKAKQWDKEAATLAHSIAEQVVAVENITYNGAFEVLELAKANIEKSMRSKRATVCNEIRDKWGNIVKAPSK